MHGFDGVHGASPELDQRSVHEGSADSLSGVKTLESTRSGILIGLAFPTPFRAHEFETAVRGLAARGQVLLKDAVTVIASAEGKVRVHETVDPTPPRAAVTGALWGSLFGLFTFGPLGWITGAALGAAGAAVLAQVIDIGITDHWVAWFKDVARPDTTTLALLVDELNADAFVTEAARFPGARVVSTSLDQATDARLRVAVGQTPPPPHRVDSPAGIDAEAQLGGYPHR